MSPLLCCCTRRMCFTVRRCLHVWQVWNTIGRALVVRDVPGAAGGDGGEVQGAAAVVARSAGVGQNHKTLCSCDGTVIWGVTPPELATHCPPVSTTRAQ